MFVKKFLAICKKRGQAMIPTENIQNKYTRAQAQADYKEVTIYTAPAQGIPGPAAGGPSSSIEGRKRSFRVTIRNRPITGWSSLLHSKPCRL